MSTHIALVEDDPDIAGLVRRHLERGGDLQVAIHPTAAAFLAASEQQVPELVILDLNLPDGEGLPCAASCAPGTPPGPCRSSCSRRAPVRATG